MNSKLIGGILLIVGTSIGGGMLALPIATSTAGFIDSTLLLLVCWLIMTVSAFLILEVNMWLPANSNMLTMAGDTLGIGGKVVTWINYLLLFYSLIAAYMAGGGDFLHNLLTIAGLPLPGWMGIILFTLILGIVVYLGIRSVDYVNRGLMTVKFTSLILLMILILPFVSKMNLEHGNFHYITASVTVAITSFGFANIVPSLRSYFNSDVKQLHKAIMIGSLIPLVCYILWDLAIMGVIPSEGANGLIQMQHSGHSTSDFVNTLSTLLNRHTITIIARIFTTICLATSFLGVSLATSDFLADSLKLSKQGKNNFIIYGATFLPPLAIVLVYPDAFIKALSYAGIYCMILLVLMPALMAWRGRYHLQLSKEGMYRVVGGKIVLALLMIAAIVISVHGVMENF